MNTGSSTAGGGRWRSGPRLRTLGHESHPRHASWLELFFDLVVVVAIAQVSHAFAHHPDGTGVVMAVGLFAAVYLAWQGFSFYADRFETGDALFRAAVFAQMLALLVLGLQIPEVAAGEHEGFAIAFASLRGILVLQYLDVFRHIDVARPLARRYGIAYTISVAAWVVSVFIPPPWCFALWGGALALDLSVPWTGIRLHREIPTDPAHVPERFGLFTIIVLGELVAAVGLGTGEVVWSKQTVAVAMVCFAVGVILWWIHFDQIEERELPREPLPIIVYAYAHIPILAGLMFVASGVSLLVGEAEAASSPAGVWALCGGLSVFLASLALAHAQLLGVPRRALFWGRSLAVIALILLPLTRPTPVVVSSLALAILVALLGFEAVTCRGARQAAAAEAAP